jgi:hypothetical protein
LKKIETHLLAPDGAFELGDPSLRLRQLGGAPRIRRAGCWQTRRRQGRPLAPSLAIEAGHSHGSVSISPLVEQLAPYPCLSSDGADALPSLKPKNNLLLQLRRKYTWSLVRHGSSSEANVTLLTCLTLGVHSFGDISPEFGDAVVTESVRR